MPKLLVLSAEEKSYRRIADGQTVTVAGSEETAELK
jgi:hypothetical protein